MGEESAFIIPLVKDREEFNEIVKSKDKVLFIFTKEGCPFCETVLDDILMVALSSISDEDTIDIYEVDIVNTEEGDDIADELGVVIIPTLVRYENGKPISIKEGWIDDDDHIKAVDKTIDMYIKMMKR